MHPPEVDSPSLVLAGCPRCGRALRLPPGARGACPSAECAGEIGPAHGPPALLSEGVAFCRWPSRWQTLRSWLRWAVLAISPWLLLLAALYFEPQLQRVLEPGSPTMGTRGGALFNVLGEVGLQLLWLGPLVEHLPLANGLGLLGLGVGLWGVAGGLRRGELRVADWTVWGPLALMFAGLFAGALLLLSQANSAALSSSLTVPWGGGQAELTLMILVAAGCSLPLLGWAYGQRLLQRRYGAIEVTSAECVVHQAGAWSGAVRTRPEDLDLSAEDEVMSARGGDATCGAAARTRSSIEELQAALALHERGDPVPSRPKLFPSLPLAGGALLLGALTSWRWGVWWVAPSFGVALLLSTGLTLVWERARRSACSRRFGRQAWGALGAWATALALLPTLPIESTFASEDLFSNRFVVTARPGAPAYRVVFISGAFSAAEAGRIDRLDARPGMTFWSRRSRVEGSRPLSIRGAVWIWCQGERIKLLWPLSVWEPRPLDTSLKDFVEGRSSRTLLFLPRVGSSRHLSAYVSEGEVQALYWLDGPRRIWPSPRAGFSQIDPLPTYQVLRDLCHQPEADFGPEDWRALAPRRARRFRTCESARVGWEAASDLLRLPTTRKLLPNDWGLPQRSPHALIVFLGLGIRALESYRDHHPERAPEVTRAIAIAQARRELARYEIRVRTQVLAWIDRGPGGRAAAQSWTLLTRQDGWGRRVKRKRAKRGKRKR